MFGVHNNQHKFLFVIWTAINQKPNIKSVGKHLARGDDDFLRLRVGVDLDYSVQFYVLRPDAPL